MNINTNAYWEERFATEHWEENGGRDQTKFFAAALSKYVQLPPDFKGHIVDFGCGLGDAMPIFRDKFPATRLTGVDISRTGIKKCVLKYGHIADFLQGDYTIVPEADIIISSNVFEHLTSYLDITHALIKKCRVLYVVVPFREHISVVGEHVNSFDSYSFKIFNVIRTVVFLSPGWSQYGLRALWWGVYGKNILKLLLRRPIRRRNKQILYEIQGELL